MSDPHSRPRPQFGEYATPEEQRAAIKAPETNPHYAPPPSLDPEQAGHPDDPQQPGTVAPGERVDAGGQPPADANWSHPQYPAPTAKGEPVASPFMRHPFDRVATITLLVLGLYNVITNFAGRGQIASQIDQAYRSFGLTGDYAVTATTSTVADVIAVVFLVLWIVAAVLSTWTITRGRIAFWIPLVAGVLASLASGVGYMILFLHDPTFLHYMQGLG